MFRFTIRDLLWLTVVVGLACAWFVQNRSILSLREARDTWKLRAIQTKREIERRTDGLVEYKPGYIELTFGHAKHFGKFTDEDAARRSMIGIDTP